MQRNNADTGLNSKGLRSLKYNDRAFHILKWITGPANNKCITKLESHNANFIKYLVLKSGKNNLIISSAFDYS